MSAQNQQMSDLTAQDNRLELLLFHLGNKQRFAINVLKVKEVIPCPALTRLPDSHPAVVGVATLRGEPLSVVDLSYAIGTGRLASEEGCKGSVIVTEFNRSMHGFLVERVDRIIMRNWKDVLPPPKGLAASYSSGVTQEDKSIIQILDVEKVIGEVEVVGVDESQIDASELPEPLKNSRILVVDDSNMALKQTARALDVLGLPYVMAKNGREALSILKKDKETDSTDKISLMVSDIEMPEMDGYSLVQSIRRDSELSHLYVLLHTSLNGAINTDMAKKAGANAVLSKFVPEDLANEVIKGLKASQ